MHCVEHIKLIQFVVCMLVTVHLYCVIVICSVCLLFVMF